MSTSGPQQSENTEQAALVPTAHARQGVPSTLRRGLQSPKVGPLATGAFVLVVSLVIGLSVSHQGASVHLLTYPVAQSTTSVGSSAGTTPGRQYPNTNPSTPGAGPTSTPTQSSVYVPPPYVTPSVKDVILGIQMSASQASYDCAAQTEPVTFTATISTNSTDAGFPLKGSFAGSGPAGPIGSSSGGYSLYVVRPHTTTTTVSFSLSLTASDPDGRYSMQFDASVPGGAVTYSNVVVVTKSC
jgi:hypothetical protein